MRTIEPIALHDAGSLGWPTRWLLIDTDEREITLFTRPDCSECCGVLTGDRPSLKLVFDRDGIIRSYFKVFDPDSETCVGSARCLKNTARKIVGILASQTP
jgi:hypothetical protein